MSGVGGKLLSGTAQYGRAPGRPDRLSLQRLARATEEEHLDLATLSSSNALHRARNRLTNHRVSLHRKQLVSDPQLPLTLSCAARGKGKHVWPAEGEVAPKVYARHPVQRDGDKAWVVDRQLDAGRISGIAEHNRGSWLMVRADRGTQSARSRSGNRQPCHRQRRRGDRHRLGPKLGVFFCRQNGTGGEGWSGEEGAIGGISESQAPA
eukprot:scaffold29832_cov112-Isochrysis_galbana.AAC.6